MEIGSFIELQLDTGLEYHNEQKYSQLEIARLNSGRTAIYHAACVLGCDTVLLPHYQCETVRDFLLKKGIKVKYYRIDNSFNPICAQPLGKNEAMVIVNYYGIMSNKRICELAEQYENVIVDNSQAFFCAPIEKCINVYSARKFVGVPDGAYAIGKGALKGYDCYGQGYSSDTSLFLLQRLEYGCEGKTYESRTVNEERIDTEDIMKMSPLTQKLLDGTNYQKIKEKRRENFMIAHSLLCDINKLDPLKYYDDETIPMVYPFLIEEEALLFKLIKAKHFQGHWWNYVLSETPSDSMEYWLSKYMIPITIDQRYGRDELEYINKIIRE